MESSRARGSETVCRMEPSPDQQAARDRIAAELAAAGFALPGTLTVRAYACGKPNCRCHASQPSLHGPYAEWTRKIDGKTVTRRLTPAELAEYQPLFDNAKNSASWSPSSRTSPWRSSRQTPPPTVNRRRHPAQCRPSPLNLWAAPHPGHISPAQP